MDYIYQLIALGVHFVNEYFPKAYRVFIRIREESIYLLLKIDLKIKKVFPNQIKLSLYSIKQQKDS